MELRAEIIEKIKERLNQIFGIALEDITEATSFADLGAKSANVSQMTTFLEDEFDVEIEYMKFIRKQTVGEAADYIVDLIEY